MHCLRFLISCPGYISFQPDIFNRNILPVADLALTTSYKNIPVKDLQDEEEKSAGKKMNSEDNAYYPKKKGDNTMKRPPHRSSG